MRLSRLLTSGYMVTCSVATAYGQEMTVNAMLDRQIQSSNNSYEQVLSRVLSATPTPSTPTPALEAALVKAYEVTTDGCARRLALWDKQRGKNLQAQTKTVAAGGVITLLGGVAEFVPVKTVLMGLGITTATSSGEGVANGVSTFFGKEAQSEKEIADNIRKEWKTFDDAYARVDATADPLTFKRRQMLASIRATCAGLYSAPQDAPPAQ